MTLIAANWKLHGDLTAVRAWCGGVMDAFPQASKAQPEREFCVCPPYPYLAAFAGELQPVLGEQFALGAQDASRYAKGAHTGEVSTAMLQDLGCRYVILGHSERREQFGEGNAILAAKLGQVAAVGLTPIFCIGETEAEEQAGKTKEVLTEQLAPLLKYLAANSGPAVIAYEPVWAIGTGRAATAVIAGEAHAFIRAQLPADLRATTKILYGGSVKPENAPGYLAVPDINGLLVGGASLDAASIMHIFAA